MLKFQISVVGKILNRAGFTVDGGDSFTGRTFRLKFEEEKYDPRNSN